MFPREKGRLLVWRRLSIFPRTAPSIWMPGPRRSHWPKNPVERQDLLIITNDFAIANLMIERGQCELIHTGGRLCRENQSTVGHLTAKKCWRTCLSMSRLFRRHHGICADCRRPTKNKAIVKQTVAKVSEKNVSLLSDSSKIWKKMANYLILPLSELDVIISDDRLSGSVVNQLNALNVDVELATTR